MLNYIISWLHNILRYMYISLIPKYLRLCYFINQVISHFLYIKLAGPILIHTFSIFLHCILFFTFIISYFVLFDKSLVADCSEDWATSLTCLCIWPWNHKIKGESGHFDCSIFANKLSFPLEPQKHVQYLFSMHNHTTCWQSNVKITGWKIFQGQPKLNKTVG